MDVRVAEQEEEASATNEDDADVADASLARVGRLFEDHEETFIRGLHAFVDRPRLAKRFVNIYRLLRVRAAEEPEDTLFAESPDSEGYRAALVLLAINIGFPRISTRVLQEVEQAAVDEKWNDFVARITSNEGPRSAHSDGERRERAPLAKALAGLDQCRRRTSSPIDAGCRASRASRSGGMSKKAAATGAASLVRIRSPRDWPSSGTRPTASLIRKVTLNPLDNVRTPSCESGSLLRLSADRRSNVRFWPYPAVREETGHYNELKPLPS